MISDSLRDEWALALDAARGPAAEAAHRLWAAIAHADELGGSVRWVSSAADAFRLALADWCDDLRGCHREIDALGDGLVVARARLLEGGFG